MEAGDSAINAFIAGSFASGLEGTVSKEGIKRVGSVISTILNSGGNSTQTYVREKEAGATDRTAMNRAFIEFALDAAFEYPIMDQVFDGWNQQGIRGALKTGGARSLESLAQNGLRTALDIVLNGDENRVNALTQAYVRGGLSEREAQSRAIWDTVGEIGAEAVVAFVGGVGETYTSNLVQRVEERTQRLRGRGQIIIDSGAVEELLEFAKLAPPDSSAHAAGEVFQENQLARELYELDLLSDDAIVVLEELVGRKVKRYDSLEVALLAQAVDQTLIEDQRAGRYNIIETGIAPENQVVFNRYIDHTEVFSLEEFAERPTWQTSEQTVEKWFSDFGRQKSFFNKRPEGYGKKGIGSAGSVSKRIQFGSEKSID